jgi:hypothetical protein
MPICIDSFERVFESWFLSDAGKEFFEGTESEFDATATVQFPIRLARICTARSRGHIGTIFRCLPATPCCAMLKGRIVFSMMKKTTTTFRVSGDQCGGGQNHGFSALATAQPMTSSFEISGIANGFQPAEGLARMVFPVESSGHPEIVP